MGHPKGLGIGTIDIYIYICLWLVHHQTSLRGDIIASHGPILLLHSYLETVDVTELDGKGAKENEEDHDHGPLTNGSQRPKACGLENEHWGRGGLRNMSTRPPNLAIRQVLKVIRVSQENSGIHQTPTAAPMGEVFASCFCYYPVSHFST